MARKTALRAVVRPGEEASFDHVVVEEPLEIRVGGEPLAVTMRTPGDDRALAVGFLLTEGVLRSGRDVKAIDASPNVIDLTLDGALDPRRAARTSASTASCGVCGKATISSIAVDVRSVPEGLRVSTSVLLAMPDAMRAAQDVFDRTGGLHAAALFGADGALSVLHEDIGRHNATDKVIGARTLSGASLGDRVLLVSGRAGFEIVQKAAVARIPVVAALSAPSSLAVDLADRLGVTLVAFLRPPRASVYTHPERLV